MSSAAGAAVAQPSDSHGPVIQAVQIVMIVLAASSVTLRFISRKLGGASFWWDDWFILAATVFSLGINIINFLGVEYGMGKHLKYIPDHGQKYLQTLYALELVYTAALALAKIGVLLMYRRLFGINRKFSMAVNVTIGLVVCWFIGVEIATLFQCEPVYRLWMPRTPGRCFAIIEFFEGAAIPNVVTDAIILILPQPIIWKLRLPWSTRLALCGIFLLGALTACTSIGRLVAMLQFGTTKDFTWDAYAVIIWFSIEPPIGIACACIPCMGPLFRLLPGSPFASTANGSVTGPDGLHSGSYKGSLSAPTSYGARSERRPSDFDTESLTNLRPGTASCRNSAFTSRPGTSDIRPGTGSTPPVYELDNVYARKIDDMS